MRLFVLSATLVALVTACNDPAPTFLVGDPALVDSAREDAQRDDAGGIEARDAEEEDARAADAGEDDTRAEDTGEDDTRAEDTGAEDALVADAGDVVPPDDADSTDADPDDAATTDAGEDLGRGDALDDAVDAAVEDSAGDDAEETDAEETDAEETDAEETDAEETDAEGCALRAEDCGGDTPFFDEDACICVQCQRLRDCPLGQRCNANLCEDICTPADAFCLGVCVDLENDARNCGACATTCPAGSLCRDGLCSSVCDEGELFCDGACVDAFFDDANCGGCGVRCESGTACDRGACRSVCAASELFCDDECVDPLASLEHCGRCGNACRGEERCEVGSCVEPVVLRVDGEACESDDECRGGTCLADPGWPNGYCTTPLCESFEDCASDGEDNRCLVGGVDEPFCVRICGSDADCRVGYLCQPVGGGLGYCAPSFDPSPYPFDITCNIPVSGGVAEWDFVVETDTTSYMVVPFSIDGSSVRPLRIERPLGADITLDNSDFRLSPFFLFQFTNPIVVPATPAFASELVPGNHTLVVQSDGARLCAYVLQESEPGTSIDMNVYLVDVPGVSASTAPLRSEFQTVFRVFDEIYGPVGYTAGRIRYFDVSDEIEEAYGIIRSQDDVEALVATTSLVGPALQDALALNVFFTRGFSFADGSGAIGISMGLPGAAGLQGSRSSGVAFTTEFLFGGDPAFTSVVLAHEVGHYLGLFHTTEQNTLAFDPLSDTPQCSEAQFPNACPDLRNLMFPLAGEDHTIVSAQQGFQIGANPLTR